MGSLLKLTNNALGRLNAVLSTSATALSLVPGQGLLFPAIVNAGEHFPCTLVRASDGAIEIVNVTAISGDNLTVVRAQEATTALAFAVNDRCELRLTGGALQGELNRMAGLLDAKADASTVAAKADSTAVTAALALKADATALAAKANSADVLPLAGGTLTGPLQLPLGSQSNLSLRFAGADSDTGLFHIGDGVIGVVCNNVLVARFTDAGLEVIKITQTT